MQSVAAYYVIVASEEARKASARARHQSVSVKRPSRVAAVLSALVAPVRRNLAPAS